MIRLLNQQLVLYLQKKQNYRKGIEEKNIRQNVKGRVLT